MPFNLFRKKKQPEEETPAATPQQPQPETTTLVVETMRVAPPQEEAPLQPAAPVQPQQEQPTAEAAPAIEPAEEQPPLTPPMPVEQNPQPVEAPTKTYLKAMPLRELSDLENIKNEVRNGNIIILKVTPLASKSIEDVKNAVNDLYQFSETIGGDIARLGEERVVICPKTVRIWREKTPAPVAGPTLPTTAA